MQYLLEPRMSGSTMLSSKRRWVLLVIGELLSPSPRFDGVDTWIDSHEGQLHASLMQLARDENRSF
jgi:hypothetical protein